MKKQLTALLIGCTLALTAQPQSWAPSCPQALKPLTNKTLWACMATGAGVYLLHPFIKGSIKAGKDTVKALDHVRKGVVGTTKAGVKVVKFCCTKTGAIVIGVTAGSGLTYYYLVK